MAKKKAKARFTARIHEDEVKALSAQTLTDAGKEPKDELHFSAYEKAQHLVETKHPGATILRVHHKWVGRRRDVHQWRFILETEVVVIK